MLADAATERQGLLNVIGGGIALTTRKEFPSNLWSLVFVLRLVFTTADLEARPHRDIDIELRWHGADESLHRIGNVYEGSEVLPWAREHDLTEVPLAAAVPLDAFEIEHEGAYQIALVADGETLIALPLRVDSIPA